MRPDLHEGIQMAQRSRGTEERRAELLEAARRLFVRDGFAEVSVSQIVNDVGVAQGTFYYYFDSKEAVLDALVRAYVQEVAARLTEVAGDTTLDPHRALERMIRIELELDEPRARELGRVRGADAHTKLFSAVFRTLSPIYSGLIVRGRQAGFFRTDNEDLLGESMVLYVHSLFDRDLFGWSDPEYARRRRVLADLVALFLGLPKGSFDFGKRPSSAGTPSRRKSP
jgi:AcrR family transcriptional regulator